MSKIPLHAKCVFKGIIYDTYHWEQEMFDGTKTTFEALKRSNTVVVLPLTENGHIFYAKQEQPNKPPFLSLFGGRAEEGEEPLESAKRELLEETGLVSENWSLLRQHSASGKIEWNIYFFVARNCQKVAEQNLDGGEKIEVCQTSIDDFLKNIVTSPAFAEYELTREILSAFNAEAFESLKTEILAL